MSKQKLTILLLFIATAVTAGVIAFHVPVLAQIDGGLEAVGQGAGLAEDSLGLVIGRIIRVILGVLGIILLGVLIYAGYLWMTAGGSDERITKAKKILINGTIGLIFILASFAITTFVISSVENSLGGTGGTTGGGGGGGSGIGLGGGSVAIFSITGFQPEGEVAIRNVLPQITFSKAVDTTTVDGAVHVTRADNGEEVAGSAEVKNNRVTFRPEALCPPPNDSRNCFDENTAYNVFVDSTVRSTSGLDLNCAFGCSSSFTTGSIIDIDNPSVSIEYPESGARIEAGSVSLVEAAVSDSTGVAGADFIIDGLVFDAVLASGEDLRDVTVSSLWDTAGFAEDIYYTLEVTAIDFAGNTDSDSLRVRINPSFCANGRLDSDLGETGLDCGGTCGACDGASCEINDECSSGLCLEGICSTLPTILSITPSSGAPGTYVTLAGEDFGSSGGFVEFTATGGGTVAAIVPSCSDGWSETEIVVEVPAEAIDGPITITTRNNLFDSTDNEFGPLINNFDVNNVLHPSLCRISPTSGAAASSLSLFGKNFGGTQGLSDARFNNDLLATYNSWSDGTISAVVPNLGDANYAVAVNVGGVLSNAINYTISAASSGPGTSGTGTDSGAENQPVISYIDPSSGGIGQYITIVGSNFGSATGSVFFENQLSGEVAQGSIDFPDLCLDDFWSDREITIIVPSSNTNGGTVSIGSYEVYVVRQDGTVSTRTNFSITSSPPTPGLCRIIPGRSEAGTEVVLVGDSFGASQGVVTFYNEVTALDIVDWKSGEITLLVPDAASSGPVSLTSADLVESNTVNFEVGAIVSSGEPPVVGEATYAWSFSTGILPRTPEVIVACTDTLISGVPNRQFTDNVCVNANVYAEFTVPMSTSELAYRGALIVEECLNDRCTNSEIVPGFVNLAASVSGTALRWQPQSTYNGGVFKTDTKYQVTITTAAKSLAGVPLAQDVIWDFTTGTSDVNCAVEKVRVSPNQETLNVEGETTEFLAVASTNDCQVLDADAYSWNWVVNPSFASIEDGTCENTASDACATATALAEGKTPVRATEVASSIWSEGTLTIDFTDPYIVNASPNCTEACINSEIQAGFNIPMDVASIEQSGAATLYECQNELCLSFPEELSDTAHCVYGENSACVGLKFVNLPTLKTGKFYRVIISGEVKSISGTPLTRTNYGDDYSWTFRVRDSAEECSISRIEVDPDDVTLKNIGERQIFSVSAYGAADSCSVAGQKLDTEDYSWDWEDPIINVSGVAEWLKLELSGQLFDSNQGTLNDGCTSSCLPTGSSSYGGACGNGFRETGEDCDDGNVADGDGCSPSCLAEGHLSGSICGDGIIAVSANGAGEECDDNNTKDGDGCSAQCTREGSSSIGATCGNNDIARNQSGGGEDCDDGNRSSGDGCSSVCLNEGTLKIVSIVATCANNIIEGPFETCDDGNLSNGDGCSSVCLREGFLTANSCGDGLPDRNVTTGAGEDCDGGEGCGRDCLWLGSSFDYSVPSVCGDGIPGIGEYDQCESGIAGDSRIDGSQIAFISEGAGDYVETGTNKAEATIRVSTSSSSIAGVATLALSCVAKNDLDCDSDFGPADNRCCMPRPNPSIFPIGSDVCRNASIYAIFEQRMDSGSFNDNVYVRLLGSSCPATHEVALSNPPRSWLARVWQSISHIITPELSAQSAGDCILPLTGFSQFERPDGTFQVSFNYNVALEPNSEYEVVLEGDELGDVDADGKAIADGILTANGVAMDGSRVHRFITSDRLCELDKVEILDSFSAHPGVFRTANEPHDLYATALTNHNGTYEELQSISGVYDWTWGEWQEDSNGRYLTIASQDQSKAQVVSTSESGRVHATATAKITTDTINNSVDPLTGFGKSVKGYITFTSVICDNPWPAYGANFPYANGDYNFSMYYCRDAGDRGPTGDLPQLLDAVKSPNSGTSLVLSEYFFRVNDGSSDAIGIRIAENPHYLSPADWYVENGFLGNPRELVVDGFEAIEVGRSIYIAAPNIAGSSIYPNIYVISYNELASSTTLEIYNQLISNFSLLVNKTVNLCIDASGDYTGTVCSSDWDCLTDAEAVECGADGEKLRRDMSRLTDATHIARLIAQNGSSNRRCSLTVSQSCTTAQDCPGTETCLLSVPQLASGTFLRSGAASTWNSWSEELASALGESVPRDPLNGYANACGENTDYPGFTAATCVNEIGGQYVCPLGSYVYHYFAKGQFGYELNVDLEYQDNGEYWAFPIDSNLGDGYAIRANGQAAGEDGFSGVPFCDGTIYGASNICGDGVIGANEACELGQRANAVPTTCADDSAGTLAQICAADCSEFQPASLDQCVPIACGNGTIEIGEDCDDGSFNGRYGYCGNNCTYTNALYCGDGTLAGGEICDCGSSSASGLTSGGLICSSVNGSYATNPGASCSWDCSGPASYCGDGVVDSGEQCDGTVNEYSGKLCAGSISLRFAQPCEVNEQCPTISGGTSACGSNLPVYSWANECPFTTVCIAGDAAQLGSPCETNIDCGVTGVCSTSPIETTRSMSCQDDGAAGDACRWPSTSWRSIDCKAATSCGNGQLEPGEQCDDGNDDTNDTCTNECSANVCGDGYLNFGVEDCDEGNDNGELCSAAYGSSCSYCSESCRLISTSGTFCGDGVINGGEYCDSGAVPIGFGICNGGANNGLVCESSGDCNGNSCAFPVCASDCRSSCPNTFKFAAIEMRTNQTGAPRATSVELQSATATGVQFRANSATLYMPQCNAASALTGDVILEGIDFPNAYVIFVTDLSSTMSKIIGSEQNGNQTTLVSRLGALQRSIISASRELYKELDGDVKIATVGFRENAGSLFAGSIENVDVLGFTAENDQDLIISEVSTYSLGGDGGQFIYDGLLAAQALMGQVADANSEKIVVLATDSSWCDLCDKATDQPNPEYLACQMKDDGYQIYTIGFSTLGYSTAQYSPTSCDKYKESDGSYMTWDEYIGSGNSTPPLIGSGRGNFSFIQKPTQITKVSTWWVKLISRFAQSVEAAGGQPPLPSDQTATPTITTASLSSLARWSSGNPNLDNGIDYASNGDTFTEITGIYDQITINILDSILGVKLAFTVGAQTSNGFVRAGNNSRLPWPEGFTCREDATQTIEMQAFFNGTGTFKLSNVNLEHCAP
ncbi:MAG: Ig-like domain-containing protein [Patescibacteria group bacterium]